MMKRYVNLKSIVTTAAAIGVGLLFQSPVHAVDPINTVTPLDDNLDIVDAHGELDDSHTSIIFKQIVVGTAGATVPANPIPGELNGAPVIGHVFITDLSSTDIGFNDTEGTVALALTAHPDFDDTPLEDENNDTIFNNDGGLFHAHWVVLTADTRVAGGLSVKQLEFSDPTITLPATHPGANFPMFIDSPGFSVETDGDTISVTVPLDGVNDRTDFGFGTATAFLEVHADGAPLLGVYAVYGGPGGLSIVPEPGSVAIVSLGFLGLGSFFSHRRAQV